MMQHISAEDLKEMLSRGDDMLLIDVREPFEHEAFHIGGTLVPLGDLLEHGDIFKVEKPVVLYCEKGIRSQIAIQRLEQKFGFTHLYNLSGGMSAWRKANAKGE
ncbi:MAG TPA: rhodanese-like domain-containing protein [Ferruginibacter sp.]|nr:rhodanese-like domain-containing protein [Ferruginibacter sp.]